MHSTTILGRPTPISAPKNFVDLFDIALSNLAYTIVLAQKSGCNLDEMNYIHACVADAVKGQYDLGQRMFDIPTHAETEAAHAETMQPILDLAEAVLNVAPRSHSIFNAEQMKKLIEHHERTIEKNKVLIDAFDENIEAEFHDRIDAEIADLQQKLVAFQTFETVDPSIVIMPCFAGGGKGGFGKDQRTIDDADLSSQSTGKRFI